MNLKDRLAADGVVGDPVLFYGQRNKNGEASNFAPYGFWLINPYNGMMEWHPTGEHRYQAMKATNYHDYKHVRKAPGPGVAKDRGREVLLREGWGDRYGDLCYYVMLELTFAKVLQNAEVATWLRQTGHQHIYEDSPTDDIWGWRFRNDYRGRNLLGRCLMEVRKALYGT